MKRFFVVLLAAVYVCIGCPEYIPIPTSASEANLGGIHILKTDLLGNGLEGAGYQVAREATRMELEDSSIPKRLLKVGDSNRTIVYVSFGNEDLPEGKPLNEIYTDRYGQAYISGLPYGSYYLVESRAPEGYNRMTSPVRFSINKYSHLTESDNVRDDNGVILDNTVHIVTVRYSLPDTGNTYTVPVKVAATGLLISAAALLLVNRIRAGYV